MKRLFLGINPLNKLQLLHAYIHLFISSVIYHKIKSTKRGEIIETSLLDTIIVFPDYGSLINLFEEIFLFNSYYFVSNCAKPLIIDCGSNIGISVIYFKKIYPNSRIICFEPDPINASFLKENIKRNNLKDIEIFEHALSNHKGKTKLFQAKVLLNNSIFSTNHDADYSIVESSILSDYLLSDIDLIKIDIEGAEAIVLEEISQKPELQKVKKIIVEFHPLCLNKNDIIKVLESKGFKATPIPFEIHKDQREELVSFENMLNSDSLA